MEGLNTVTYHFENGAKQVSNINKAILLDEKGRKRSKEQIEKVFADTMWDLKAQSFEY